VRLVLTYQAPLCHLLGRSFELRSSKLKRRGGGTGGSAVHSLLNTGAKIGNFSCDCIEDIQALKKGQEFKLWQIQHHMFITCSQPFEVFGSSLMTWMWKSGSLGEMKTPYSQLRLPRHVSRKRDHPRLCSPPPSSPSE